MDTLSFYSDPSCTCCDTLSVSDYDADLEPEPVPVTTIPVIVTSVPPTPTNRTNRTNRTRLLDLSASLLAGGAAGFHQPLPGSGQQLTKVSKHKLQSLSAVHPFKLDGVQFQFYLLRRGLSKAGSLTPDFELLKILKIQEMSSFDP